MFNKKIAKLRTGLKAQATDAKMIVIEGADRRGKQTQTKMLTTSLRMQGFKAVSVEVPVHDVLTYRLIYWMLGNGLARRFPHVFQTIQFLNKKIFQVTKLKSLLKNNDYVVFDRWALAAVVYGTASNTNWRFNRVLYNMLKKPDVTVLIEGNMLTTPEDAYERDNDFQKKVVRCYEIWSAVAPVWSEKVIVISNVNASKTSMHRTLVQKLREMKIV